MKKEALIEITFKEIMFFLEVSESYSKEIFEDVKKDCGIVTVYNFAGWLGIDCFK